MLVPRPPLRKAVIDILYYTSGSIRTHMGIIHNEVKNRSSIEYEIEVCLA